ncbi:unnamed protein product, partial [Allacma fusca]
MEFVLCLL